MHYQPSSFESLRPCELGITLASGGWSWRITTPGLDPPEFIYIFRPCGKIVGSMENNVDIHIAAGVQQGCVPSPRLFCSVLETALSKWRAQCNGVGYDLQVVGVSLLELRFADAIRMFAKSYEELVLFSTLGK